MLGLEVGSSYLYPEDINTNCTNAGPTAAQYSLSQTRLATYQF